MKQYLDFDLLIEKQGGEYRSRVLNSPAGQAHCEFKLPFSDQDVEILLLKLGRPRRGTRRLGSPEMLAVKNFGARLFDAAFGGDVRACFRTSLDQAVAADLGLRIRLRLSEAPELVDLPWEYLYNPSLNQFLCLSVETPLVRYVELAERVRALRIDQPLQILVMIASPIDYPDLDVEQEWLRLKDAVTELENAGQVILERLREANLRALQKRLRKGPCHIFHFVGHGGFDSESKGGTLLLEDIKRHGHEVSSEYLGTLLHDHRALRLVVLNSCEGARTGRVDSFSGAAQRLVQQGVPAVIAMQFEISNETAVVLAHEFYSAVADGWPVDAALTEARKAIYALPNDLEWGTPVLYLRTENSNIFELASVDQVKEAERRRRQQELAQAEAQAVAEEAERRRREQEAAQAKREAEAEEVAKARRQAEAEEAAQAKRQAEVEEERRRREREAAQAKANAEAEESERRRREREAAQAIAKTEAEEAERRRREREAAQARPKAEAEEAERRRREREAAQARPKAETEEAERRRREQEADRRRLVTASVITLVTTPAAALLIMFAFWIWPTLFPVLEPGIYMTRSGVQGDAVTPANTEVVLGQPNTDRPTEYVHIQGACLGKNVVVGERLSWEYLIPCK